ncbi:MAG: hypothetical protein NTY38_22480, partial [Acidobacteria bacterium]|nr:hypothetical protein [Acidobacteriota bacterium]
VVVFGYTLAGLLIVVRAVAGSDIRAAGRLLGAFSMAVVLSVGSIAFLLLPLQAAAGANPMFHRWYGETGLESISFDYLFTLISPSLTYDVSGMHIGANDLFPQPPPPWCVPFFYVGITPLLLLPLVRRGETARQRLGVAFLALGAGFFLLKLLGVPPAQWIGYLPGFRHLHFRPYACAALTLALSGLVAAAVESLLRQRPSWARIGGMAAGLLLFYVLLIRFAQTHPVQAPQQPAALLRAAVYHLLELLRLTVVAGALLLVTALRRNWMPSAVGGALVLAIMAMELVPLAYHQ